jgi:hypothetical protein
MTSLKVVKRAVWTATAATLIAVTTACGSMTSDTTSVSTTTPTGTAGVTTTVPATTIPPTTLPSSTIPVTTTTTSPPPTQPAAVMPDVIGLDLQSAQDLIQTTGVFFSRSFDCTGRARSQVVDRNWVVVTQIPEPGAPLAEGDAVLGVVQFGEPASCP